MPGLTLDAGALIAFDREERDTMLVLDRAIRRNIKLTIPAGALAQAWRDGRTQTRLAVLVRKRAEVEVLDSERARAAGQLCGVRGTSDIIDASIVLGARRRGDRVMTSDPEDLRRLDPTLELIVV